jgi:hypothetical protein
MTAMKEHEQQRSSVGHPEIHPLSPAGTPPAGSSFAQTIGLTGSATATVIITDLALSLLDTISLETLLPFCAIGAAVVGRAVYGMQKAVGDKLALEKALLTGFLTAIPVPISALLAVPAGFAGMAAKFKKVEQ